MKGPYGNSPRHRWLKRLRRELAASGAASQLAVLLAAEDGESPSQWERRLRQILDESLPPDPEILFRIETHLARPRDPGSAPQFLQARFDL